MLKMIDMEIVKKVAFDNTIFFNFPGSEKCLKCKHLTHRKMPLTDDTNETCDLININDDIKYPFENSECGYYPEWIDYSYRVDRDIKLIR